MLRGISLGYVEGRARSEMKSETQMGLNALLHESTLEDIAVDTDAAVTVCTLTVTARPKVGPGPGNPCTLRLNHVSRVRAALVNPDGSTPPTGMPEIPISELNRLIRPDHPQMGFDFIDSGRLDIFNGLPIVDWRGIATDATHTCTFFYGVRSSRGQDAVLLIRIWFDSFDLWSANGQSIEVDPYFDPDALGREGIRVVRVPSASEGVSPLPDAVPAQLADGAKIALLFMDPRNKSVRARAVGEGTWDGQELKWLSPSGTLYDLPPANQSDIRPALAEWNQPGDPMGGFAFWTVVEIARDDLINAGHLVEKYLKSSFAPPRLDS